MTNKLLIIDPNLNDLNIFTDSLAEDVKYILHDNSNIDKIYENINTNANCNIGFVYHSHASILLPFYRDTLIDEQGATFAEDQGTTFTEDQGATFAEDQGATFAEDQGATFAEEQGATFAEEQGATFNKNNSYPVFSMKLINFIKDFKTKLGENTLTIDLITCDTGKNNFFIIEKELGINIRYSSDPIGNIDAGGDNWVMDYPVLASIKSFYFTPKIDLWIHDLLSSTDIADDIRNGVNVELKPYIEYNATKKIFKVLKDFIWPYVIVNSSTGTDNYISLNDGEIFDGNHCTISFGATGTGNNVGIFASNSTNQNIDTSNIPKIQNLTIKSYINGTINNTFTSGFMRDHQTNFKIVNCHHIGNIYNGAGFSASPDIGLSGNSIYIIKCSQKGNMTGTMPCGGIVAGGISNNITTSLTDPPVIILIKDCWYKGSCDINNSGGICGSDSIYGCFGNSNSGNISATFENCKNYGSFSGKNSGGICAGSDFVDTIGTGCFGNANYGILNVTFKNCQNHGSFTGKNSGGICAGGDCSSGCLGGGCFGNFNTATGIINVAFKNCKNYGSLTGKNSGGVCAGGDNASALTFISGGGCFANYNNGDINVSFLKCKNKGSFGTADNAGGICAGGDNNNQSIGGGCFGNFNGSNSTINVKIIDCTNSGNFNGKNTGGICGGGDNYLIGGGCFGHYNRGNINVDILNNINSGSFSGINSGGICAGGNTIIGTNIDVFGTGCFGNYNNGLLNVNFKNCHNSGLFANGFANCGGICGGGRTSGTTNTHSAYGFGCFGNANGTNGIINVKFINCNNSGALSGKNSGGICAGGDVDVRNSYGGGCFGNFNSGNLTVLYKKCYNSGSFDETSLNVGGICAGGDISNSYNNIFGGGCFANYNTTTGIINVAFDSCQNSGKLNGKNAGGICAGGDCNPILTSNLSYVKGGGCFGNASLGKIKVLFTKCKNSGKFNGISSGGICGGGNNTYLTGGGCFANYILGESFFNIKFND